MRENEDRRDRDLLVEIHTMTKNLSEGFEKHQNQDREDFSDVRRNQKDDFEKVHKRINRVNWYIAMGMGGLIVIQFVLNFSRH